MGPTVKPRIALAAVASLLAIGGEARAFECTRSDARCSTSAHWETRHIPYVIRRDPRSRYDEATIVRAVEAAFGRWQSVACSDLTFSLEAVLDLDTPHPPQNAVVFLPDWGERKAAAGAITSIRYGRQLGVIRSAVIRVNESITTVDLETCDDELELTAVLTHEVGHFVGIAHPCEFAQDIDEDDRCPLLLCEELTDVGTATMSTTMWPRQAYCDPAGGILRADDAEALCFVYPRAEDTRQCASIATAEGALVSNQAFGCQTSNAPASIFVLMFLFAFRRLRTNATMARDLHSDRDIQQPIFREEIQDVSLCTTHPIRHHDRARCLRR